MDAGRAERGARTTSETSETGETSEPRERWGEAMTLARASAADQTPREASAASVSSRNQLAENGVAAEEGQGENTNGPEATRRTRAWEEAGDIDEALDLSSLSLTTLAAALPAGLRRLNLDDNQLTTLPHPLPAGLQRLYASGNRLSSLPDLPAALRRLYAISNRLTSLPAELPPGLRRLNVNSNRLTDLPDLPPTLQELDASGNHLTSLPALPAGLERLNVDYNQLADLPDPLPAALEWLSASHNRLTSLPETVPSELLWLDASNNQLTSVPEPLLARLGRESSINLEDNPLPEEVQANLVTARQAGDYAGPQVFFTEDEGGAQVQLRSLSDVVADWLVGEPKMVAAWQGFAQEPGAQQYVHFLDRLRGTVNYDNETFRRAVRDDLRQAAIRPRLREQYFQLALDASTSCEDRITLTWNGMRTARLNVDVEDGVYDGRLEELLQHGRVMFRLETLDGIARDKVKSLRRADPDSDVDEIEVYLAYQNQLRDPLELWHIAPDMRFLAVSHVDQNDVAVAETFVRNQEKTGFADYLATRWQPWATVASRIAPEDYEAMEKRLADAVENEFKARLAQSLAALQMTADTQASSSTSWLQDAERELGAEISSKLACEIKGDLLRKVLTDRGLAL